MFDIKTLILGAFIVSFNDLHSILTATFKETFQPIRLCNLGDFAVYVTLQSLDKVWMCCKGFRWKVNLFVTEVSFENVTRVMGFTYVFDNGEKWKCLLMSMFFGACCVFGRASSKNDFLRVKLVFKFVLKWKVFPLFLKMVKSAICMDVRVFLCFVCLV